ncbi:regulatory protein [Brevibacterium sanguinis]|uniref:Regulatory protein RecX n=2 Tax=Brevibacterium TaxID=1696 RepID=A0A366IRX3_9MICO|nr:MULTISPECIES: regulatory protein RecX [Brevibacterium]RBP67853.1 regulatory protein [Brevibacterium sanguinis]RBP74730.1 regulatory protein [Brevibacterium celere]
MTSRSPESDSHTPPGPPARGGSGRPGEGSSAAADEPALPQMEQPAGQEEQLAALRSAIGEIDRRHAEGESFFAPGDDGDVAAGGLASGGGSSLVAESDRTRGTDDDGDSDVAAGEDGALVADEPIDVDAAYAKAKKTAMNMLAMRDHSSSELREKLEKRDIPPAVIDELIAKLRRSDLLDDAEFAQRYVRAHRERRKLSRGALRRELTKKGIEPEIIADVVEDVEGEEELARQVAEKKAASSRGLDHEVRQRRILGMLARRGFSSAVCLKVTRDVLAEDE